MQVSRKEAFIDTAVAAVPALPAGGAKLPTRGGEVGRSAAVRGAREKMGNTVAIGMQQEWERVEGVEQRAGTPPPPRTDGPRVGSDTDPAAVAYLHGALRGAPQGVQRSTARWRGVNGAPTCNLFDWPKL